MDIETRNEAARIKILLQSIKRTAILAKEKYSSYKREDIQQLIYSETVDGSDMILSHLHRTDLYFNEIIRKVDDILEA